VGRESALFAIAQLSSEIAQNFGGEGSSGDFAFEASSEMEPQFRSKSLSSGSEERIQSDRGCFVGNVSLQNPVFSSELGDTANHKRVILGEHSPTDVGECPPIMLFVEIRPSPVFSIGLDDVRVIDRTRVQDLCGELNSQVTAVNAPAVDINHFDFEDAVRLCFVDLKQDVTGIQVSDGLMGSGAFYLKVSRVNI